MAVLKAMTSGGTRRELDFYPTPPEATLALLPLIKNWPEKVWEPCCGDGAISKVLTQFGYDVFSTDIVDRGYGDYGVDFFKFDQPTTHTIITNPPYGRAHEFIRHAYKLDDMGVMRMALLLKINFFSTKKGRAVFDLWRPSVVAPLTWRLDFTGAGSPHTDCMWVVWEPHDSEPTYELLGRPA